MNNEEYKFVWNKLLSIDIDDCCKYCVFKDNGPKERCDQCYMRDINVYTKYSLMHIYIKNEESSE